MRRQERQAVVLALGVFRLWKLAADDAILDRYRDPLLARHPKLDEFVSCPWCLGFWMSAVAYAAWRADPERTTTALAPFALSAAVGLIATHRDPPE